MKKIICFLCLGMLLSITNAFALPVINIDGDGEEDTSGTAYAYYQNSGTFMFLGGIVGTGNYNDEQDYKDGSLELMVEAWLGISDTSLFSLKEESTISVSFYDDNGNEISSASESGTWETASSSDLLNFYVVKAANNYAIYYVDPADYSGSWSTYDLFLAGYGGCGGLEISHFTGFLQDGGSEVPEPATMLLFGTGLIGIGALRSRKKRS